MLKLEFLPYHYNLSDRSVIDQAHYNMAFRLFLRLSPRSELPDPSLLSYFRSRLGVDRHQRVFDKIVGQAREKGLVKDRLRLKDATHVLANIAIPSTIARVAQTRGRLLQALRHWGRSASLARSCGPRRCARRRPTGRARSASCSGSLTCGRLPPGATRSVLARPFAAAPEAERQDLAEALQLAHKVLADRDDGPDVGWPR